MQEYYIYIYMDPRKSARVELDNVTLLYQPFYVGKGKGDRMNDHMQNLKRNHNPIFRAKLNKLKTLGEDWPYRMKIAWFDDADAAYAAEEAVIARIGSEFIEGIPDGPLTNICLGARPPSLRGKTYDDIYGDQAEEQRRKRNALQQAAGGWFNGRSHSDTSRAAIGQKARIGQANGGYRAGIKHTEEGKAAMAAGHAATFGKRKVALLTNPKGETIFVLDLFAFCLETGISAATVNAAFKYRWPMLRSGSAKGWTIIDKVLPDVQDRPILFQIMKRAPYLKLSDALCSNEEIALNNVKARSSAKGVMSTHSPEER